MRISRSSLVFSLLFSSLAFGQICPASNAVGIPGMSGFLKATNARGVRNMAIVNAAFSYRGLCAIDMRRYCY